MISFNDDPERKPTIDTIQTDNLHDKTKYVAEYAQDRILVAHRVTSPLLFGIRTVSNGFSSQSEEMKTAYSILQTMTITPFQNLIINFLAEAFDKGGYFIWIQFKTIRNTSDFLKICEKNRVKFHPGNKFSTNSSYGNCIRLSFSYYDPDDLILGLERIMDSVIKYNSINVLINGASGKLGSLIKKEILNNIDFNYVGDISRKLTNETFDGLISYNSVIIDVSSNEATYNLLTFLINQKLYLPLIIGTTGLSEGTNILLNIYSKTTQWTTWISK